LPRGLERKNKALLDSERKEAASIPSKETIFFTSDNLRPAPKKAIFYLPRRGGDSFRKGGGRISLHCDWGGGGGEQRHYLRREFTYIILRKIKKRGNARFRRGAIKGSSKGKSARRGGKDPFPATRSLGLLAYREKKRPLKTFGSILLLPCEGKVFCFMIRGEPTFLSKMRREEKETTTFERGRECALYFSRSRGEKGGGGGGGRCCRQ